MKRILLVGLAATFASPAVAHAKKSTRVCVEVVVHDPDGDLEDPPSAEGDEEVVYSKKIKKKKSTFVDPWTNAEMPGGPHLPLGQTPEDYLARLMEYYITHQPGYQAVETGCQQTVKVEMYSLLVGWTVFARYTGNEREERVDQVYPTELSQFAERAVLALLGDVPINATINKENVLKADSKKSLMQVKGQNHFTLGVGTQLRLGLFDTALGWDEPTENKIRFMSPMLIMLGYRGQFENLGIEAMTHVSIGTQKKAAEKNQLGGHIDLGGDVGLSFHMWRYIKPRGLISFYVGSGATFELLWFSAIREEPLRYASHIRDTIVSGGLDLDLVFGWEFMRSSSVQFYLQGELNVPVYLVQSENEHGSIKTWYPAVTVRSEWCSEVSVVCRILVIAALAFAILPGRVMAAVDLCVEVTSIDDEEGLEKLVLSELGKHPSHHVVEDDCESTLEVELFAMGSIRYLTLRIDMQVPARWELESDDDIAPRLVEGISLVLGNDPVHLKQNIGEFTPAQKAVHGVLVTGQNIYRLEIFQAIGRSGENAVFAPGLGFALTRGSGHWYVLARIYLAGWPGTIAQGDRSLRILTGIDAGLTFEASIKSSASFYVSAAFGLQFHWWEGWVAHDGEQVIDEVNRFGVTASCRVGVRFLRFTDFDIDLWAAGYLPMFATKQTDAILFGEKGVYTPTIQVGIGVGF